ncbi:hypothetical protein E8E11_003573 [Didymella keratinophila]|nr:hypothetical protein E8E11_003573 [Didymella keratinophila]
MEALIAVGLAGNVVQFVTCAASLVAQVNHLRQHDTPASLPELVQLSRNLTAQACLLKTRLKSSAATLKEEDQNLLDLSAECEEAGHKFIEYLKTWEKKPSNILQSAKTALKFQWKLHQIEEFARKIEKLRGSLTLATILALRSSAESNHEDVLTHLKDLQINVRKSTSNSDEDERKLQSTIDALSNSVQQHTVDRLDAIQGSILACVKQIQGMREEHMRDRKNYGREQALLTWLDFRQVNWRYDAVEEAHRETFNWIFDHNYKNQEWNDFRAYLTYDTSEPYFINGKAGSGKSTLMKFIVDSHKTRAALNHWSGQEALLILPFFFWNLGTTLQKSHVGLLRVLLHTVLKNNPELVPAVLPKLYYHWKDSDLDMEPQYVELKKAFALLIEKTRYLRLAIFIDGVDEFEGNHHDMSLFLRKLVSPRVKVVVSNLTRPDMTAFVKSTLSSHHLVITLLRQFPTAAPQLATEIVEKATGVFLWVTLVVRLLIEGLEDGDNLEELQERLRSLPPDLRDLYSRMLSKMSTRNQRQASEVFQIVKMWDSNVQGQQLPGLVLSYSMNSPKDCFDVPIEPMDREYFESLMSSLSKRIRSRCCGLLEVHHVKSRRSRVSLDDADKTVVAKAEKLPPRISARYLLEIDKKMTDLQNDIDDGDENYRLTPQMHWSAAFSHEGTHKLYGKHASIGTFAAEQALYYFPIPAEVPQTDYQWFVCVHYALEAWMQDKEHISTNERTRTLTYLSKRILGLGYVKFEDDLWRHAIAICWQLVGQERSLAAAGTLRVFLSAPKRPYATWDRLTQIWKGSEDDPTPLLEKLQALSEEVSWAELSLQDELPQEVDEIERLIRTPPGTKPKRYTKATRCKPNKYYPKPVQSEYEVEPSMYTRYKRRTAKAEEERKKAKVLDKTSDGLNSALPALFLTDDKVEEDGVASNTSGDDFYLSESPPPLDDETFQLLYGEAPIRERTPHSQ